MHIPVMHAEDVAAWAKRKEATLKDGQSEQVLWKRAVSLATQDVEYFLQRDESQQYDFCMQVQQRAGQYVSNPVEAEKPF